MADTAPSATLTPISYTWLQVCAALMQAGWTDADIPTAAAICEAESSRNSAAISLPAPDGSRGYGLWQIEYPTHKELFDALPEPGIRNGDWIDGLLNAKMALSVKESQGFGAWTTYKLGVYAAFLPQAQLTLSQLRVQLAHAGSPTEHSAALSNILVSREGEVIASVLQWRAGGLLGSAAVAGADATAGGAQAAVSGVNSLYTPFTSVLDFLNALGRASTWERIAQALIGGALVVVALKQVATPSKGTS